MKGNLGIWLMMLVLLASGRQAAWGRMSLSYPQRARTFLLRLSQHAGANSTCPKRHILGNNIMKMLVYIIEDLMSSMVSDGLGLVRELKTVGGFMKQLKKGRRLSLMVE